jgi:uridine phosphorylase
METFHLFHLATCWAGRSCRNETPALPLVQGPATEHDIPQETNAKFSLPSDDLAANDPVIKAAAALMVFAVRSSSEFITPEEVQLVEHWAGLVRIH